MNSQERLFIAIGAAAPELIARSERRKNRRFGKLAVAACLMLILALGHIAFLWAGSNTVPPENIPSPEQGAGTMLRLLSYAPQSETESVDFLIYINEEQYMIQEENGIYSIKSIEPLPDGFPTCGLDIFHLPSISPDTARESAAEAFQARYKELHREEETSILPESLYLRASNGTEWDSEQAELWFSDDGQGGCFVLAARYFLEAEEGIGLRFRDMVSSFRMIPSDETMPDWMRSLYKTTNRLFPALLSNHFSDVSDLLAADADVKAYGENVWETAAVASVDYALDNGKDPTSAVISVKHRLHQEEGEDCHYLTMKLTRQDGQWLLLWSRIEE